MANNSLSVFVNDGLELVIDTATGEAFATQAGYARMSGLPDTTIASRFQRGSKGVRKESIKSAEILTPQGLRMVRMISADIVFMWLMEDNPDLAFKMGTVGATVYLHQLAGYKVKSEPVEPQSPPAPPLPPADVRVVSLVSTLNSIGFDTHNPRFSQSLKDLVGDILGLGQHRLPATDGAVWCGVAERAEQLGYPVGQVTRLRSALGRFVSSRGIPSEKEMRLCNGRESPINVYKVTQDLDNAIHAYMKSKV